MSDKKQKVLIVHNYYQIPGGEDTVVANEKKMLENHGHEVVLYTRHNSELNEFSKIRKVLLPFSTIFNLRTYREVKELVKSEMIDVIHVHNTLNLISPSVYYAGLSCKAAVIQTVHNFRLLCPGATFYREGHVCEDCVKKGLLCSVKYNCYRGSKVQTLACVLNIWFHRLLGIYKKINYICLTEFNKEKLLQNKQIENRKVFIKPNFVNEVDRIIPFQERKKQFVYVGRLDSLKGVDFLLQTWKEFSKEDYQLVVCGTGPLEEWCKEYIKTQQLENIELRGFVDNETARKIIGESRALILPTRWYEGFPMTIAESYSVGTLVLGSDLGNVGSLIENGKNGWKFAVDSKEQLCEAMEKVKMSQNGVDEETLHKYSQESNYEQLRTIYETCCNYN